MKLFHRPAFTGFLSSPLFLLRLAFCLVGLVCHPLFAMGDENPPAAQSLAQATSSPKTRTVVADILMIDGAFYVVRGERGEIRIEVTPDTKLSGTFKFGDRIKAILLPNDEALSITKAQAAETIGTTSGSSTSAPTPPSLSPNPSPAAPAPSPSSPSSAKEAKESNVRIIIADLLMVDRNLYIIRGDYGEIQIEVTPQTQLSETFKFGDRIKARVTPDDKALSIVRANPGESPGIRLEEPQKPSSLAAPSVPPPAHTSEPGPINKDKPDTAPPKESSKIRTVVAEILMVDGAFYVVRGERGEIRIEVTPETKVFELFKFGDKIKAKILPNDTAVSIERAKPDDPFGDSAP